jgi:hypothetical protein
LQAERDFFEQFAAERMAERAIDANSRFPSAPLSDPPCEAGDRDELLAAAGGAPR